MPFVHPPLGSSDSGDSHPNAKLSLDSWNPLPGEVERVVPDEEFIFYNREMMIRGDEHWPPSITSYYSHPIPLPNIDLQYIGRGKNFLKLLISFKKRVMNTELNMMVEEYAFTVPAWQGENNLIHLIEAIPGETPDDLNMDDFYETIDDIDLDYLTRMRMFYTDEELTELAPEVFYYEDPVQAGEDVLVEEEEA